MKKKSERISVVKKKPRKTNMFDSIESLESIQEIIGSLSESSGSNDTNDIKNEEYKGMVLETLSDYTYLFTTIIFNASGNHTSIHWSQLDQLCFAPLLPTILNHPPPLFSDTSFGPVKDGYILDLNQEKALMKYLPTFGQAILVNSTFDPFTKPTDLPLISESYNLFSNEPCLSHFKEFQRNIQKLSNDIKKRGKYLYMSNSSRSVNQ